MTEINWAPVIPLIGGFPLGAMKAFNNNPKAIYSYSAFKKNDSHYVHYLNDIKRVATPYDLFDEEYTPRQIDVVVSTPPCAGLSQLNTGKKGSNKASGSCAMQNEWMYRSTQDAITHLNPKVIIGENAPALYTKMGEGVAENLYNIAKQNGYSVVLYKTSTYYHGLPQKRDRCFYFLFKSEKAPILNFYRNDLVANFTDYLKLVPNNASLQENIRKDVMHEPYYNFLQHLYKKDDVRDEILEKAHTAHAYVVKNGLMDQFVEWAKDNHEKGYKLGLHAKNKFADGKGVWDGSIHVFKDHMNALIGRALMESIHPTENRSLNVREAMHMMGIPHDFELLGGRKNLNHIAQNVPTFTARDMCLEAGKFIRNQLQFADTDFLKINNHHQKLDTKISSTLESFLG
jgi:site-specific DNA-cytosine methylase